MTEEFTMWGRSQCCWDCTHSLLFRGGTPRERISGLPYANRPDGRGQVWERLFIKQQGAGGEPFWDQPQAKHQIQEPGDEGVWGLSLYPGLSGKRASFPFLYSLFFSVLYFFTGYESMIWKIHLIKMEKQKNTCTLNIQYLLAGENFWKYTHKPSTVVSLGRELGIRETGWEKIFLSIFLYVFIKILTVEIHSILFPTCTSELLRPGSSNSFPDSLEVGDQEGGSANCMCFHELQTRRRSGWMSLSCCFVLWLPTS